MHRHFRIFFFISIAQLAHAITLMTEWSMYCVRKKVILTGSDTEACDCSYNPIKITLKYQKYFYWKKKIQYEEKSHTQTPLDILLYTKS